MTTTDPAARQLVAALTPNLPLALGSLRVWGDWFGKPLDNLHVVVGAQLDGHGTLVLEFKNHEVLRVARPRGWIVRCDGLWKAAASADPRRRPRRVGWYYYGRPEAPENWFEEHHWREGEAVRAATTATWYVPSFAPTLEEPAVIFL